ncbi:Hypothetical predicted protein [Paramuricea clavata]|uniref:Uncharacterized protein n=1 Tax=Paramuricea clavata TaxID=317549 RepID=A0A6S7H7G0_PARCT|nr:Hypothetical predicted protein [Paramuricea clavata]
MPLRDMHKEKTKTRKWNTMIEDLSQTYGKENHGAQGRIRLLSTIANHFSNKELKKAFPCTNYKITEARRKEPTSHVAPDNKVHLYKKYKEECCKNGRCPISETKFCQGLEAGNFKEMAQMVGLCNICDVIGARNWEDLNDIIEELKKEISAMPIGEVVIDCEKYADSDEITDKMRVVMVDLTDKDTEFLRGGQCNPLSKDSPILLMPVNNSVNLSYYACNKNNSMDEFLTRAKVLKEHLLSRFVDELDMQSACPFHNMSWLLGKTTTCPTGEVCEVCVERFNLFDDINATILTSKLDSTRYTTSTRSEKFRKIYVPT